MQNLKLYFLFATSMVLFACEEPNPDPIIDEVDNNIVEAPPTLEEQAASEGWDTSERLLLIYQIFKARFEEVKFSSLIDPSVKELTLPDLDYQHPAVHFEELAKLDASEFDIPGSEFWLDGESAMIKNYNFIILLKTGEGSSQLMQDWKETIEKAVPDNWKFYNGEGQYHVFDYFDANDFYKYIAPDGKGQLILSYRNYDGFEALSFQVW